MSAEPSMEEILSSIKRIISEEGEGPARGRRSGRAAPPPPALEDDEEEVLELSDPVPADFAPASAFPHAEPEPPEAAHPAALPSPDPEPAMPQTRTTSETRPAPAEPLLSRETAEASRSALDSLSRLLVKPEPGSDGTLEGMVREMLRPVLREWLDANLPAMVERMVEKEIARITAGGAR